MFHNVIRMDVNYAHFVYLQMKQIHQKFNPVTLFKSKMEPILTKKPGENDCKMDYSW